VRLRAQAHVTAHTRLVQVALAMIVLLALPSPIRPMPALTAVVLAGGFAVVLLVCAMPRNGVVRGSGRCVRRRRTSATGCSPTAPGWA
jgi:hypothetical protein